MQRIIRLIFWPILHKYSTYIDASYGGYFLLIVYTLASRL
ncbi:hypothetical protein P20652_2197 [Pseudoalteromonas sp. BSi20652]|nr:hypothetical protein P20652_2197 [Pseudoalteromonas sp. BSi20652]